MHRKGLSEDELEDEPVGPALDGPAAGFDSEVDDAPLEDGPLLGDDAPLVGVPHCGTGFWKGSRGTQCLTFSDYS